MSTQADHGHEPVPRPEQTPDALRAALAVVGPKRLPEMQRTEDEAFARAVQWQSLSPVRSRARPGPGASGSPAAPTWPPATPAPRATWNTRTRRPPGRPHGN
ncbi:hypothetical protein SUDANB15_03333 [Streptomyces sp. enrichment culture]